MDYHVFLRLLLKIVSLLSFASCTLPARLLWNSSASPTPCDNIPIRQPVHTSDVTLSLSQDTTAVEPASPSSSPPPSASINQSANITVRIPTSPSPSPNDYTSARHPTSSSPSPSDYTSFPKTVDTAGIVVWVIIVEFLVIVVSVAIALKKKRAAHDDAGDSLVAGTDIRAYTTGQPGNPNGNSLEVGVVEICTHTVEEMIPLEVGIDIRTYTMEELAKATHNFTTKVGQGVSGFVYRANLPGKRMGAVKRATDLDPNLFKQELSVLLRLPRHPHLVDLIGLCLQPGEQILVFEFISNGSLHDRLHKNKGNNGLINPLSWTARMEIAYQVAVALQYLHDEAKPPILHRDVKSANVLLVNDNSAKLADFGLSKLGPKDNQFTITAVRGSYGYMDPQYVKTRRYSAKSDVYSFGVLLLELITGLKPLHDDTPLAEWTLSYRSEGIDRFLTIVDRNMVDHINTRELQNMIEIANLCLAEISEERCLMRDVVNMMQKPDI